jgi:hypothetical protein
MVHLKHFVNAIHQGIQQKTRFAAANSFTSCTPCWFPLTYNLVQRILLLQNLEPSQSLLPIYAVTNKAAPFKPSLHPKDNNIIFVFLVNKSTNFQIVAT